MNKFLSTVLLVILGCMAFPAGNAVWAQPAPGAAPPPVTVYEVDLPDAAAMATLTQSGLDVANVKGLTATVYVRENEQRLFASFGWSARVVGVEPGPVDEKLLNGYRSNPEIAAQFATWLQIYPTLCTYQSIGKSANNQDLWAIKITQNPTAAMDKPVVCYISTIHGNEPVGTEMCLRFCDFLLTSYGSNARIKTLVNGTVIWVLPLMNPDGMNNNTRFNAHSVDLNRSFPMYGTDFTTTLFDGEELGDANREPETAAVMRWEAEQGVTLAANFHGGAVVVNYPYDYEPGVPSGQPAISPDEDLFRNIALRYATPNPAMRWSTEFADGVTNGSAWYILGGGLQDWSYRFLGSMHMTIELSSNKWPVASTLDSYWADNQASMLAYAEAAHMGVRGLATDRVTGAGVATKVMVQDNAQPMFGHAGVGNFHRPLLPGTYNLSWSAPGYITCRVNGITVANGAETRVNVGLSDGDVNGDGQATAVDLQLVINAVLGRASTVTVNADVDGGGVTATDVQAVVNMALHRR